MRYLVGLLFWVVAYFALRETLIIEPFINEGFKHNPIFHAIFLGLFLIGLAVIWHAETVPSKR